jgi:hypothetical protein
MRAVALLPLVAVTALAGCTPAGGTTSGGFSGAEKDVATVVGNLATDGQRRKESDICDALLSRALAAKVAQGGQSCAEEMKKAIEDADQFTLDVQSVNVTGTSATARVKSTDRSSDVFRTFRFVQENGGWRIDSFG